MATVYDGFVSCKRTNTDGITDTYTFWFEDGVTETINIATGSGFKQIDAVEGAELMYLITFDDGVQMKLQSTQLDTVQWGSVTGNLEDQTDLQNVLDTYKNVLHYRKEPEYEETDITASLTWTDGYITASGSVNSSETLKYSNKISVTEGQIFTKKPGNGFRFVTAYNGDSVVSAKGSSSATQTYTVPSGITHIIVTVYKNETSNPIIETEKIGDIEGITVINNMGYMLKAGELSDGEKLTLPFHNVKNGNRYLFTANITEFSSIIFHKNNHTITFDDTNITLENDLTTVVIPHGLTIANNISIEICNETAVELSEIRIESSGNVYKYTSPVRFLLDEKSAEIESDESTLTNCVFSWVSTNINAPIWAFGDSYFSWYESRWTYYLAQDKNTKSVLLNGFAGQTCDTALNALKNLLKITTPKIVFWCMGMNNSDSGAVNATWKACFDELKELQEKIGFELVLYTVPKTTARDHTYKNAVIRDSGYRYVDIDATLRVDSSGHWITGTLSEDEVHPTALGAKVMYYKILSSLPEIMSNY